MDSPPCNRFAQLIPCPFDIKRIITDVKEKVQIILDLLSPGIKFDVKDDKLTINLDMPEQVQESISKKFKELISDIKEVKFKAEDKAKESQQSNKKDSAVMNRSVLKAVKAKNK